MSKQAEPTFQHMGVEITLSGAGMFMATIRDVVVRSATLKDLRGEIETEVKKAMSNDRKVVSVHVVLLHGETVRELRYRGVSAKDGSLLVATMAGEKEQIDVRYGGGFSMLHPEDPDVRKVQRLAELRDDAKAQAVRFQEEIAEVHLAHKVEVHTKYLHNDRGKALKRHEHIMGTLSTRGIIDNADD